MLKQELLQKVPMEVQREPYFKALLDYIKRHNLQTTAHLSRFLQQETALVQQGIATHKHSGGTNVKVVRDKTIELELLQKCSALLQKYS